MLNAVTEKELKKLVKRLLELAHAGDMAAAKLVLNYTVGRPAETVDPDRLDVDEWKLLDDSPTVHEIRRAVIDNIPPDVAAIILRGLFGAVERVRFWDIIQKPRPEDFGGRSEERRVGKA